MPAKSDAACKVDRVAERRGLTAIDERLADRWADGESLRDLEAFFNEAVLRAAMTAAGMETIDGEPSNLYRLLTDDSVTAGKRVDAESRLRRNGVDPDAVVDDFVSYQTVRTHLNDCLGVGTARESTFTAADARNTVHKLVSRTESVTLRTIERLCGTGALSIAAPSVTVSVRVACSECNDEYTFSALLDGGGCSCPAE
ncbi:rod-determining factor RdfA [Haloarcula litorea]|uniref:rod-determining factor RdfA n=1 Tax=Haloarcula litorea TaxID=3032579 RepID=UPI0023E8F39B|nr:rod-determining factor RdfA [Halomicroarcula sp. GDY20]